MEAQDRPQRSGPSGRGGRGYVSSVGRGGRGGRSGRGQGRANGRGERTPRRIVQDLVAFFDGSAEPNPGNGGAGWVIKDAGSGVELKRGGSIVTIPGTTTVTSNQAEYAALIEVLRECIAFQANSVKVKGDSELVILQMSGSYRVSSPNLRELHSTATRLARQIPQISFESIPREENAIAYEIARTYSSRVGIEVHQVRNRIRNRNRPQPTTENGDFSWQWLDALRQNVGNIEAHNAFIDTLWNMGPERQKLPPQTPPPPVPHSRGSRSGSTSGRSTPGGSVITQSDLTESSNSFSNLELDDDDDTPSGSGSGRHSNPSQGQAHRMGPGQHQNVQVRYLLKRAQCGLAEAYRASAEGEAHHQRWITCAGQWIMAYDVLNHALQDMDPWAALLLDHELNGPEESFPDGHDEEQLRLLLNVIRLVQQDTEKKRTEALEVMQSRLRDILRQLRPLRSDRDAVKARMGEDRWMNNPNPKMTYAEKIIQLHQEKILLESAIRDVEQLQLRRLSQPTPSIDNADGVAI